jgi:hypothetical protein
MGARKLDQAVDAFSAPRDLLRLAQLAAKARGMSKSGFYRYCLAKELDYSETAALSVAEHSGTGNFKVIEAAPKTPITYSAAKKPRKKPRP